jgi:hypothetical protein
MVACLRHQDGANEVTPRAAILGRNRDILARHRIIAMMYSLDNTSANVSGS